MNHFFSALTDELGPLSALDQQFCEVISLTDLGRFTRRYEWCGNGCPAAEQIRARWEKLKSATESLVVACASGDFDALRPVSK